MRSRSRELRIGEKLLCQWVIYDRLVYLVFWGAGRWGHEIERLGVVGDVLHFAEGLGHGAAGGEVEAEGGEDDEEAEGSEEADGEGTAWWREVCGCWDFCCRCGGREVVGLLAALLACDVC